MTDPAVPQSLGTEIADLKRRLAALERSPQLKSSSIKGGALNVYDSSGNAIAVLGEISATETGLVVYDAGGAVILHATGEEGIGIPVRGFPWRESTAVYESTTSGTFTSLWGGHIPAIEANALHFQDCTVTLNAADTAEVRVRASTGEVTDTVVLSGAVATLWTVVLNWEHGLTRGAGPITFSVQARRSAGTAAAVNLYEPTTIEERNADSIGATSGGLTAS